MKRILHVVGARPNFMKIRPIMLEMARHSPEFSQKLVHTGQHYDAEMSEVFFAELELPRPDVNLGVGSGTHAQQTAQVMVRFEPVVLQYNPDWVVVVGDVNSTLASALVCSKLGIKVAHVEAGLRSFDRSMPEEINRTLIDHVADLLFTSEPSGKENLRREGIPKEKIHFVGNVMIDTLVRFLPKAQKRWCELKQRFNLSRYALATLHRPFNVDDPERLSEIIEALNDLGERVAVLFPMHPRTHQKLYENRLSCLKSNIHLLPPLCYLDFLALQAHAELVITDSGGIQEETTFLGVPCLTVRPNTERPITITNGTNRLVNGRKSDLLTESLAILGSRQSTVDAIDRRTLTRREPLELWDGHSAERIVKVLVGI
jgi:UDP-N-acetylglucosamine 2-epimerase (non-hydrolysing)